MLPKVTKKQKWIMGWTKHWYISCDSLKWGPTLWNWGNPEVHWSRLCIDICNKNRRRSEVEKQYVHKCTHAGTWSENHRDWCDMKIIYLSICNCILLLKAYLTSYIFAYCHFNNIFFKMCTQYVHGQFHENLTSSSER